MLEMGFDEQVPEMDLVELMVIVGFVKLALEMVCLVSGNSVF